MMNDVKILLTQNQIIAKYTKKILSLFLAKQRTKTDIYHDHIVTVNNEVEQDQTTHHEQSPETFFPDNDQHINMYITSRPL